jgi:cytochrome P450
MSTVPEQYTFPPPLELMQDPYAAYAALRAEGPVHVMPGGEYVVPRYQECRYVMQHPSLFSNRFSRMGLPVANVVELDPPEHKTRRAFQSKVVAPRSLARYEQRVTAFANDLIDGFVERGAVDFVNQFAYPLAFFTMAAMLGLGRENYDWLTRWARKFQGGTANAYVDQAANAGGLARFAEMYAYVGRVLEERLEQPPAEDDLITDLIEGQRNALGSLDLSIAQADATAVLIGGLHTAADNLSNAMLLLLDNPDELQKVLGDRTRIPAMLDEALRVETSGQWIKRIVREDTELAETMVPAGATVILLLASGNRDEQVFEQADRFDVDRPNAIQHLSFGSGPHFCLGAPIARLETRIGYEQLLRRVENIRLAQDRDDITYQPSIVFRVPTALRVEFDPVS